MGADGPDDRDLFLAATAGVTPLDDRQRVPAGARAAALPHPARPLLEVEYDQDRVHGRARGVTRQQVDELRSGAIVPAVTLDLHRRDTGGARSALGELVRTAVATGHRHLLVVHGKGLHSGGEPVLRDVVVAWLAASPHVRAFTSAPEQLGGTGALVIELWIEEAR